MKSLWYSRIQTRKATYARPAARALVSGTGRKLRQTDRRTVRDGLDQSQERLPAALRFNFLPDAESDEDWYRLIGVISELSNNWCQRDLEMKFAVTTYWGRHCQPIRFSWENDSKRWVPSDQQWSAKGYKSMRYKNNLRTRDILHLSPVKQLRPLFQTTNKDSEPKYPNS